MNQYQLNSTYLYPGGIATSPGPLGTMTLNVDYSNHQFETNEYPDDPRNSPQQFINHTNLDDDTDMITNLVSSLNNQIGR